MERNFVKLINSIENELHIEYIQGAIAYIDKTYDEAWFKAMSRFDFSLGKNNPIEVILLEAEIYKEAILKFIRLYKIYKRNQKTNSFLESLREEKEPMF